MRGGPGEFGDVWRLGVRALLKTLKFDAEHPLQVWLPQLLARLCRRSIRAYGFCLWPSGVDIAGLWAALGLGSFSIFVRCNPFRCGLWSNIGTVRVIHEAPPFQAKPFLAGACLPGHGRGL